MEPTDKFDLVLWGATGFTGQLVAEYLAEQYEPEQLNWAIAGRNKEKLQQLQNRLGTINDACEDLPVRTADALDRDSLDTLTDQTDTICSTVGPYAKYGTDLVASCIHNRTDYCDLTGEVQWIRRMIDRFHEDAQSAGVRIVHSCGFDSVPADIGTLLIQQYAQEQFGAPCQHIQTFVTGGSSFQISGGTAGSILHTFEETAEDSDMKQTLNDPYALAPEHPQNHANLEEQTGPRYDTWIDQWTAPFLMAMVNERIVRRSQSLQHDSNNHERYQESIPTGEGIMGLIRATGITFGLGILYGCLSCSPLRWLLRKSVFPASGEGPSREQIENGSFRLRMIGHGRNPDSDTAFQVECSVSAPRDPGYGATAWMLGESAVALATRDTNGEREAGILTPATALGEPLADRLRKAGMTFDLDHQIFPT